MDEGKFTADEVLAVLVEAEETLDRDGWDNPQLPLFTSIEHLLESCLFVATTPLRVKSPPGEWLTALAVRTETDPEITAGLEKALPNLFGLALFYEGWSSFTPRAELPPGMGHADMPDAKEIRGVAAVDIYGRVFVLRRERGERLPSVWHNRMPIVHVKSLGGTMPQALCRTLLAIMRCRPGAADSVAALSALVTTRSEAE